MADNTNNGPTATLSGGTWSVDLYGSVTVDRLGTSFRLASADGRYSWSWMITSDAAPFSDTIETNSGLITEATAVYDWALAQAGL